MTKLFAYTLFTIRLINIHFSLGLHCHSFQMQEGYFFVDATSITSSSAMGP